MPITPPHNPTVPTLGSPLFILDDSGVWKIPAAVFLGTPNDLAAQLQLDLSYKVPGVFRLRDQDINLDVKGTEHCLGIRLDQIRMRTHFTVRGDGTAVPTFGSRGGSIPLDVTWPVPNDMTLIFGMTAMPPSENDGLHWLFNQGTLYATKTGSPGFYRLPLPNVYTDGRICMGNGAVAPGCKTLDALLDRGVQHFIDAPWNADLLDNQLPMAQSLFRFDTANGNAPLPPESNAPWDNYVFRVNHPHLNRFSVAARPVPVPTPATEVAPAAPAAPAGLI